MNQDLALLLLGEVMQWDSERATEEFAWLQLFSRFKYDGYGDYIAGLRFVESLAYWLQQFEKPDRQAAYDFVRSRIIYFSEREIQHLIELVYPDIVEPILRCEVATALRIPDYLIWSRPDARKLFRVLLRRCLFFGLSDGARIDVFRRASVGTISNEQVLLSPEISSDKWTRVHSELQKDFQDLKDQPEATPTFQHVFLLDDFTGTGYTAGQRLGRFWENVEKVRTQILDENCRVIIHHYIGTAEARSAIEKADAIQRETRADWFKSVQATFGIVLDVSQKVTSENAPGFFPLIQKYYDPAVRSSHTDKGGKKDIRLGFGECALPVVLEHNTPNNSVALLWGETNGANGAHPMRPLFRRRQRHIDFNVGDE